MSEPTAAPDRSRWSPFDFAMERITALEATIAHYGLKLGTPEVVQEWQDQETRYQEQLERERTRTFEIDPDSTGLRK